MKSTREYRDKERSGFADLCLITNIKPAQFARLMSIFDDADEAERLEAENAELRKRIEALGAEIERLRGAA